MAKRVEAIVEHQYSFSPERVFDCWIRPESIRLWMGAALQTMGLPGDLGTIEVDSRVGGRFLFTDRRPTGDAFHWGTYKEIDRPHRLVFTWNAGGELREADDELSLVTITISATAGGCALRLVHSIDARWRDYLERTQNGWRNMAFSIDKFLSGLNAKMS